MGRTTVVRLVRHLEEALVEAIKATAPRPDVPVEAPDDHLDDEAALFADREGQFRRQRGFFSFDEAERRSRRVDLRGPLDRDPGPIPMEEADVAPDDAVRLDFG